MAKMRRFAPNGGGAGTKIVQVNKSQGFGNMANMQGTTRVIYDAVPLATTTTNTTINLFENCSKRQFPLTNLSENKLQVGETMAMQRFSIYILGCATGTTNLQTVVPLSYFPVYSRIYGATLNFNISQDTVIKRLPLTSMKAEFNSGSKFMGYFSSQPTAADPVTGYSLSHDVYTFDNDIIIPPQIEFVAQIQLPPIALASGFDSYLCMKISGLGSLYAPKSTY